jgi:hypothetical protein
MEANSRHAARESVMTERTGQPVNRGLRITVILLAGIETVLIAIVLFFVLSQVISSNEQLGRSIGWALAAAVAAPFVLLTLPALILGIMGRRLKLALVLAIIALLVPLALRFLT